MSTQERQKVATQIHELMKEQLRFIVGEMNNPELQQKVRNVLEQTLDRMTQNGLIRYPRPVVEASGDPESGTVMLTVRYERS